LANHREADGGNCQCAPGDNPKDDELQMKAPCVIAQCEPGSYPDSH
jgi:hypothetical protein